LKDQRGYAVGTQTILTMHTFQTQKDSSHFLARPVKPNNPLQVPMQRLQVQMHQASPQMKNFSKIVEWAAGNNGQRSLHTAYELSVFGPIIDGCPRQLTFTKILKD
jgi:hypothetical protein